MNFIKEKHKWQYRDEFTPYWSHPMLTAIYCFENWWDLNQVFTCLLHDTLEYTETTYNTLVELFWEEVTQLVKLVSFQVKW